MGREQATVVTPDGLCHFKFTLFSFCNALAIFMWLVGSLLRGFQVDDLFALPQWWWGLLTIIFYTPRMTLHPCCHCYACLQLGFTVCRSDCSPLIIYAPRIDGLCSRFHRFTRQYAFMYSSFTWRTSERCPFYFEPWPSESRSLLTAYIADLAANCSPFRCIIQTQFLTHAF